MCLFAVEAGGQSEKEGGEQACGSARVALRLSRERNASRFQVFRLGLGRAVRICLLLFWQNVQAEFSHSLSSGPAWDKMACALKSLLIKLKQ